MHIIDTDDGIKCLRSLSGNEPFNRILNGFKDSRKKLDLQLISQPDLSTSMTHFFRGQINCLDVLISDIEKNIK